MNFLNEVASTYPLALSFASGRPAEQFFRLPEWLESLPIFMRHYAEKNSISVEKANHLLAQYGRTTGIINELIARQIFIDQDIICRPDDVIVTSGCQEALMLCLKALFNKPNQVLLVCNPTYIGITGLADLEGLAIEYLELSEQRPLTMALEEKLAQLNARNIHARAIYLIPDFDNPSGQLMAESTRKTLLNICQKHNLLVLEDNPYGLYRYQGDPVPTLFQLDTNGHVIYLGTYSKTLCPALRVGYLILPKALLGESSKTRTLALKISEIKSFITVNTSLINQAIVGGILIKESFSLKRLIQPTIAYYANNRTCLLASLAECFSDMQPEISWNNPSGGFFMTVKLPFVFDQQALLECAQRYNILVMPLSFFALNSHYDQHIRLAFSNLNVQQINTGVKALAQFVRQRMTRATT